MCIRHVWRTGFRQDIPPIDHITEGRKHEEGILLFLSESMTIASWNLLAFIETGNRYVK